MSNNDFEEKKLADSEDQLQDGRKEYEKNMIKRYDFEEKKLADSEDQLQDGRKEYEKI